MAHQLQISPTAYGDIERGKTDVNHSRIEQIAKILGFSTLEFFYVGEWLALNFAGVETTDRQKSGREAEKADDLSSIQLEIDKLRSHALLIKKSSMILNGKHNNIPAYLPSKILATALTCALQ